MRLAGKRQCFAPQQDGQIYDSGNNEPRRGFGHIAIFTDDVYKACSAMEAKGVTFKKRPDDGRMKGLAFAYDPDGKPGGARCA